MDLRMAIPILLISRTIVPLYSQDSSREHWRSTVSAADEMRRQGRLVDAEHALQSALEEVRALEPDPAPAATIHNNLAGIYQDMGRCDPAVRAYQRSVDLWEKVGARAETYLLRTANHLIGLYLECGAVQDAERHHRALVAPRIATRPGRERDPDVAQAIANRGSIAYVKHRYREARADYEEAVAIQQRASSEPSKEMAILLNNLAFAFLRTGEIDRGLAYSRRSIAMLESTTGSSDPLLISTLANTANLFLIAHRPFDAEPLFDRALAMARSTLGEEHPVTAGVMSAYATLLKGNHRKQEGAVLESRAREIRLRLLHSAARETVDVRELSRIK
jgi:tetratricopeptide (TPR) repeat protein